VTQYKYRDHAFDETLTPAPGTLERMERVAMQEARMNEKGEVSVCYKQAIRSLIKNPQSRLLTTGSAMDSAQNHSVVKSMLKAASLATIHTEGRGVFSALVAESISSRGGGRKKRRGRRDVNLTDALPEVSNIASKSLTMNDPGREDRIIDDPIGILTNVTGTNAITADSVSAYASRHFEGNPEQPKPKWKTADSVPRLFRDRETGAKPYSYVIHPEVRIPPGRRDFEPKVLHRIPENERDRDFVKHVGNRKDVLYPQAPLHLMPELPKSISAGLKFQTKFYQRDPPKPSGTLSTYAVAHTIGPSTRTGTAATVGMTKLKSAQSSLYPRIATTAQGWKLANRPHPNPEEISAIPLHGHRDHEPLMMDGNKKLPRSVSAVKFRPHS